MIEAPASRRSSGESALTVAFVPTGMNWGVSMMPWVSVNRPPRARVEPSAGGATSTANDAAGTSAAPTDDAQHDRQEDGHDQHGRDRDVDRQVVAVDHD